jgi:hypothetical protein
MKPTKPEPTFAQLLSEAESPDDRERRSLLRKMLSVGRRVGALRPASAADGR